MNDISLQMSALNKQLESRAIVVSNILHLARTVYKPGVTVRYNDRSVEPVKTELGKVTNVERLGSEVMILVAPLRGRRVREVRVEDIIGIMLEGA